MSALRLAIVVVSVATVVGCGSAPERTRPAALKNRLLTAASFKCPHGTPPMPAPCPIALKRTFEWANPIDYTVQGVPLPEAYSPSQAVAFIKEAGFEAAAGQEFTTKDRSVNVQVEAIKFRSKKGARRMLRWLHDRNLELPCYSSCTEVPGNLAVSGIPGAKGAKLLPQPNLPPGGEQGFTAYAVEFSIGDFVYVVQLSAPPGATTAQPIVDGARTLYRQVSRLPVTHA